MWWFIGKLAGMGLAGVIMVAAAYFAGQNNCKEAVELANARAEIRSLNLEIIAAQVIADKRAELLEEHEIRVERIDAQAKELAEMLEKRIANCPGAATPDELRGIDSIR